MSRHTAASTPRPASRIPEFQSRQQEAEWWDTHDVTDYLDELQPTRVRFASNLSQSITIRFDPATLAELRVEARKLGMAPTTLARMWILQRLHEQ